jgi:hypothetical protein
MAQIVLPPPTRMVGQPDPAGDMDKVITALLAMSATDYVTPTGDPTGVDDAGYLNEVISGGGTPVMGPGTYYWAAGDVVITNPAQSIWGSGHQATIVSAVGTGDILRQYGTGSSSTQAGALKGFTIDGTNAGAGSAGFHIGDGFQYELDIRAQNFTGAGSTGVWLDNQYTYTEQVTGRIYVANNSNGVVLDNSTGTSLSPDATGSFDRFAAQIYLVSGGAGNGVTLQNGAVIVDPAGFGIWGNMTTALTQYACLTLTGSNVANGYSLIKNGSFCIGVELRNAGGSTVAPYTIYFGTPGSNLIENCAGVIDFGANATFANSNNFGGGNASFQFDGPVIGDTDLIRSIGVGQQVYNMPALSNGTTINTRFASFVRVTNTGAVTGCGLQGFNPDSGHIITIFNIGTGSVTMASAGTSKVADGTADAIQPNTAATYHWNFNNSLWYRVYGPLAGVQSAYVAPAVNALAFGSSIAVNAALGNDFRLTLTASTGTLANPANPVDGQEIKVQVTQGTGGSFTLAYGTAYDFGAAGAPALSTAAGKVDILRWVYNAALSKWCYLGAALGN